MALSQLTLPLRQDVTFFKRAQRLSTPHFIVYWAALDVPEEKNPRPLSQVSIIVPKHQLKTSVQRHRVKRQFRAAWQKLSAQLVCPTRVVLTVNRSATTLSATELTALLVNQVEKINAAMTAK